MGQTHEEGQGGAGSWVPWISLIFSLTWGDGGLVLTAGVAFQNGLGGRDCPGGPGHSGDEY